MTPAEQIAAARKKSADEHREWEEHQQRLHEELNQMRITVAREVKPYLRPARSSDYTQWLRGFLEHGGKVTHAYDRPMRGDWYVARGSFTLPPLYGAQSLNIIIPKGITVVCSDPGHSGLYWMDGYRKGVEDQHFTANVPVFSDTEL